MATGLVILIVTAGIASADEPGSIEIAVFRWFNDPSRVLGAITALVNPLLRPLGLTLLIVTAIVLLALTRSDVFWRLVASASAAGILAYVLDNAMKVVIDRGRPPVFLSDVLFHGYPTDPRGSGFPSSHTAVAVAVVIGAWPWLDRPWRLAGVVLAVMISVNRMYVGAHFPLDIVGGAAVGLMAGGAVVVIAERFRGSAAADG